MCKGVLWYDIKNNKSFKCPCCGTDLVLEERKLRQFDNKGNMLQFNMIGVDSQIKLFCPRCNTNMTHQLKLDGNGSFKLISFKEKEDEKEIKYNKPSNGFFKEE